MPENSSYSDLTAFLTAAGTPSEVDSFPYLRGLDGNGTGNASLFSFSTGTAVFEPLREAGSVCASGRPEGAECGELFLQVQVH